MSLALCPQVESQAPQHFRSPEKQATCEGCFARQSICCFISLHCGMSRAVQPRASHDQFPAGLDEDSLQLYWAGTVSVVWDWEKPADHPSVAQNLLMIIVHTVIAPKHLGYFLSLSFLQLNACSLLRENRTLIKWLVCLYFKVDWFWWGFVFVFVFWCYYNQHASDAELFLWTMIYAKVKCNFWPLRINLFILFFNDLVLTRYWKVTQWLTLPASLCTVAQKG